MFKFLGRKDSLAYRYTLAVIVSFIVIGIKFLLSDIIGLRVPFLAASLAIVVSSLLGGIGPGVLSIFLTDILVKWYFIPPLYTLNVDYIVFVEMFAYLIEGLVIVWFIERLRKARKNSVFLANIIQYSDDAIIGKKLDGKITSWNNGAKLLFGYTGKEIIGKHISLLAPIGEKKEISKQLSQLKKGKLFEREETIMIRKDGSSVYVSIIVSPIKDEYGNIIGASRTVHNITKRKEAENKSAVLFRELNNVMNALNQSSIVAVTDKNGIIQSVNEKFIDISGFSKSELIGKTHRIINSGYHPKEFFKKFWVTILSGKVWSGEIRNRKKNGEIYWVFATVTPVLDKSGKPIQFISIRTDITEQKRLQLELKESNELLEKRVIERTRELHSAVTELARSNDELTDFASIASHDLQEPLRKIQSFGAILKEEYQIKLKAEGALYIEKMVTSAERMRNLIENLLTYSRVTTKAQPYIPVNLYKLAAEVVNDLELRIEDLHAIVKIDKLPTIDADPHQMQQLFQNLIANGLKFHKHDGVPKITISSESLNDKAIISFTDNGIGFDEKYKDRIFNIFERLHGKNEYEGTGIGLAVCRKIVNRHGGEITVKSKPGKGSVFIVSLPIEHKEMEGEHHV